MKPKFQLVIILIVTSFISSCGGYGDSVPEVNLFPVKNGNEFQYINKKGEIVINPQFKKATVFRDGLALVQTSGDEPKYGYITEDGKFAFNSQYKEATVFSNGLAWVVTENAAPAAIDKKGEIKFTLEQAEQVRIFKDEMAAFSMVNEEGDVKWGFVNKNGKVVINPQFSSVLNFSDGKCGVSNTEGKWGFINNEGKIIISYQFDYVNYFKNGKCVVTSGNKDGVIDKNGKYIINPQFSEMMIDGDIYLIKQDRKWGWCDQDGKLIINPQFARAFPFNGNSITSVRLGDSYGYIDKDGKIVINPQFEEALPFNGELAIVSSSKKIGFIDNEGKYVINPQFDDISEDLIQFILDGINELQFSSVNTDYFNVGAVTSSINFDKPEGFMFSSTFNDVMKKYELKESAFKKYRNEHEIISYKKITNDVSFNFYVYGRAFDMVRVKKGDGYWAYYDTEYRFNGKNTLSSFKYSIKLTGKGYGKEDAVISEIQSKLNAYKKDEEQSNEEFYLYSDGKKIIELYSRRGVVIIEIREETNENIGELYEDTDIETEGLDEQIEETVVEYD